MIRPATLPTCRRPVALEQELFGPDAWSESAPVRQEIDGPGRRFVVADDLSGYAVSMTAATSSTSCGSGYAPRTTHRARLAPARRAPRRHLGRGAILLEVSETNESGRAFYEARQFSLTDVRPRYYRDGSEALVMGR